MKRTGRAGVGAHRIDQDTHGTVWSDIASHPKPSDVKRAGILYLLAGTVTLLLVTVSEALFPNYSVHSNTISDLAALGAPTALIEGAEGLFRSFCLLAGGYFLFRGTGKRALMTTFMLVGVGMLLATLSPENVNVAIHSLGAVISFFSAVVAMILSFRMIPTPFRYLSIALGALSLAGILVLFLGYYSPLVQQTLGPGGWERVIAYPILIWLIGLGSTLLTPTGAKGARDEPRPSADVPDLG